MSCPYEDVGFIMSTLQRVRDQGLDKFYTSENFARHCVDQLFDRFPAEGFDLQVEPSAGAGSFLRQLSPEVDSVGIDIFPEDPRVQQGDFFEFTPPPEKRDVLVVGNPPFGRGCSLAVRFFNQAARWSKVIAFIVPRTFRRRSVQNKLNLEFHLVHDEEVPSRPCVFSPAMSVKCCFQIWERRESARPVVRLSTTHAHWDFLPYGPTDARGQPTPPEGANFAIRAYGGRIGEIRTSDMSALRPKSWHWIRAKEPMNVLKARFEALDFSISRDTARQNSMGRADLVSLYEESILHESNSPELDV